MGKTEKNKRYTQWLTSTLDSTAHDLNELSGFYSNNEHGMAPRLHILCKHSFKTKLTLRHELPLCYP